MKRKFKSILCFTLSVIIFASLFVRCSSGSDMVNTYDENGIPVQAMDLMQFYCDHRQTTNYINKDNIQLAFAFLCDNELLTKDYIHEKNENSISYKLPYKKLMDVFQFMVAGTLPAGWWNEPLNYNDKIWTSDYTVYNCRLEFQSLEQPDESTMTVIFDRYYDDILFDKITFTMEKQPVESIPDLLKKEYGKCKEIWKIRNVAEVEPEFSDQPKIVEIYTAEDFKAFTKEINKYGDRCNNNFYLLKADIDFNGAEITPIGTMEALRPGTVQTQAGGFGAIFDGEGHTLSNFTIAYNGDYLYAGLFSRITAGGIVKNLNIEEAVVKPAEGYSIGGTKGTGLLAGYCNGRVENCTATGTVEGGAMVGGMVGHLYGLPEDGAEYNSNFSYGVVLNSHVVAEVSGYSEVGNFTGMAHYAYIENSSAEGNITAFKNPNAVKEVNPTPFRIGGFSGTAIGCNYNNCDASTTLTITGTPKHAGAFSATCESSSFYNCSYEYAKAPDMKIVSFIGTNATVGVSAK